MKIEQEIMEMFDKEIIDYFWNKKNVIGTQRLSLNHITKIKSFISHIITLVQKREREEMVEQVGKHTFKMDISEYLPKVKAWQGGYDKPFDDGYEQAKKDIINLIKQRND